MRGSLRVKLGLEIEANSDFTSALGEAIFDVSQGNATFAEVLSRDEVNPLASTGRKVGEFLFDLLN